MKEKEIKSKLKESVEIVAGAAFFCCIMTQRAFATDGVDAVLQPLNNIKVLVFAIISVAGAIIFGVNIYHFASALKDRETSTMQTAFLGAAGGAIMFGISTVLAFLGIS